MPICHYGGAACYAGAIEAVCKHEEEIHGKSKYVSPLIKQDSIIISVHSAECIARYKQKQRKA